MITVPAGQGKSWIGPAFMRLIYELSERKKCTYKVLFHSQQMSDADDAMYKSVVQGDGSGASGPYQLTYKRIVPHANEQIVL